MVEDGKICLSCPSSYYTRSRLTLKLTLRLTFIAVELYTLHLLQNVPPPAAPKNVTSLKKTILSVIYGGSIFYQRSLLIWHSSCSSQIKTQIQSYVKDFFARKIYPPSLPPLPLYTYSSTPSSGYGWCSTYGFTYGIYLFIIRVLWCIV